MQYTSCQLCPRQCKVDRAVSRGYCGCPDVALVAEDSTLATFNFEFYVNPSPADGTEPEAVHYYNLATLGQINDAIGELQAFRQAMELRMDNADQRIGDLELDVLDLRGAVFG